MWLVTKFNMPGQSSTGGRKSGLRNVIELFGVINKRVIKWHRVLATFVVDSFRVRQVAFATYASL